MSLLASVMCPDGRTPRVCRDECGDSVCAGYGQAVCHADVCDDCRIKFYDEMGEEIVNCRGKLMLQIY